MDNGCKKWKRWGTVEAAAQNYFSQDWLRNECGVYGLHCLSCLIMMWLLGGDDKYTAENELSAKLSQSQRRPQPGK